MKKTLLLSILLTLNPLNADNTNMREEDMINQIIQMQQQIDKAKSSTAKKRKELEDVKKLGKTVDKLAKKLGVD